MVISSLPLSVGLQRSLQFLRIEGIYHSIYLYLMFSLKSDEHLRLQIIPLLDPDILSLLIPSARTIRTLLDNNHLVDCTQCSLSLLVLTDVAF